jgi:DeoR/GlpR family transcriptional regulator of sugar metabolism
LNEQVNGEERLRYVVGELGRAGRVGVAELARDTGHSEMTIRRDLDLLESQGVLRRVRGGAVGVALRGEFVPFALRDRQGADVKRRIAAVVAELIRDGEAVALDNGTTCLAVARELSGRPLTVMPLSVHAAVVLGQSDRTKVILPGGEIQPSELAAYGAAAEAAVRAIHFDTAVVSSCAALPAHGLTTNTLSDAAMKRALLESAARVVVAIESHKLERTAMAAVAGPDVIDVLVTDEAADAEALEVYRSAGAEIRFA